MGRMEEHFKGFGIKSLTEVYSVPRLGGTVLVECGQWFSDAPSMFNPQNLYLEDRCSYTNMLAFPLLLSHSFNASPSTLESLPISTALCFLPGSTCSY